MSDIFVCTLFKGMNRSDILEVMKGGALLTEKHNQPVEVVFHGFDDDPREIAQIPEARELIRMWIEEGGIGITDPEPKGGLSALMLIAINSGEFTGIDHHTFGHVSAERYQAECKRGNALMVERGWWKSAEKGAYG
jgi:hypothetical protein